MNSIEKGISEIILRNIVVTFENENIIKGISLEVRKGDCISIVGPSGSGKSTLLKLCADLISVTSGEILYKGRRYLEYKPEDLRKEISYCVQTPYLFGDTVYDNLEFPFKIRKEDFDREKVVNLLKRFNLSESYLDKDINVLSGGEKQRISIIRSLIFKPEILLLDEATSALDSENSKVVEKYIKELNKEGVTVLWITHNLEQSNSIFNKKIIVSEGSIERIEELK